MNNKIELSKDGLATGLVSNLIGTLLVENNSDRVVKLLTEYDLKEKNGIYLSGPIMTNGKLLVTASNGIVYAISPYDGTIEHKIDLKEELPYSPISANNSVVFATSKANLIVYK